VHSCVSGEFEGQCSDSCSLGRSARRVEVRDLVQGTVVSHILGDFCHLLSAVDRDGVEETYFAL
jgi:hypothetical protein